MNKINSDKTIPFFSQEKKEFYIASGFIALVSSLAIAVFKQSLRVEKFFPSFNEKTIVKITVTICSAFVIYHLFKPLKKSNEKLTSARQTLQKVDEIIENTKPEQLNPQKIEEAKSLLQNSSIQEVLKIEYPQGDSLNPFLQFNCDYKLALQKLESLQFYYNYFIEKKKQSCMTEDNEIPVKDDGNCLFASFATLNDLTSATKERIQTVEWMKENWNKDDELKKKYLPYSLCEHYLSKEEKLIIEQEGLNNVLNVLDILEGEQKELAERRLKEIPEEMNILKEINMKICPGDSAIVDLDTMKDVVMNYFDEMKREGVHGGAAELYALSCRHQVCAKIYKKDENGIDKKPYMTMNEHFKTIRHFTHTTNHYNAYFPPY